jgi:hypothetical protein
MRSLWIRKRRFVDRQVMLIIMDSGRLKVQEAISRMDNVR